MYLLPCPVIFLSEKIQSNQLSQISKTDKITELELTTSLPLVISLMASLIFLSLLARP